MKKLLAALVALFTLTSTASAMSYEQARERALFLTDKMAYELNLTDDQYEAAYEINLDYLMSINDYNDLYGNYWRQRNLDLSYILLDWQYRTYCAASYFYRPLYWQAGCWHFGIYARYPRRNYFYFGHPHFYTVYCGGHSWRNNGGRSWYHGRTYGTRNHGDAKRGGMRDGFDRGDYGHGYHGNKPARFGSGTRQHGQTNVGNKGGNHSGNRSFGNGNRESSTRTTVTRPNAGNGSTGSRFGNRNTENKQPSSTFTPNSGSKTSGSRSFGSGSSSSSRSYSGSSSSGSRSFGSGSSSGSRSYSGSSSSGSRSFGSGSSSGSRSFGSGSKSSSTRSSGGSSSHGGSHFGGRR